MRLDTARVNAMKARLTDDLMRRYRLPNWLRRGLRLSTQRACSRAKPDCAACMAYQMRVTPRWKHCVQAFR